MGLKNNFIPGTKILSAQINHNFTIIQMWDIQDEIPAGNINGTNLIFTTVNNYVAGSLIVMVDGIRQIKGITKHYTETGANTFAFNSGFAPQNNQDVICDYRRDIS